MIKAYFFDRSLFIRIAQLFEPEWIMIFPVLDKFLKVLPISNSDSCSYWIFGIVCTFYSSHKSNAQHRA
jgi:hypothetical protein